jgi:hypothetical protein
MRAEGPSSRDLSIDGLGTEGDVTIDEDVLNLTQ